MTGASLARSRYVVVFCPRGNGEAQRVAEAFVTASEIAQDVTVIEGDFMLPSAEERGGAAIAVIDLGGLLTPSDRDGAWMERLAARMRHASDVGGDVLVLVASNARTDSAPDGSAGGPPFARLVGEAASRLPGLRVGTCHVPADLRPDEASRLLIAALAASDAG